MSNCLSDRKWVICHTCSRIVSSTIEHIDFGDVYSDDGGFRQGVPTLGWQCDNQFKRSYIKFYT